MKIEDHRRGTNSLVLSGAVGMGREELGFNPMTLNSPTFPGFPRNVPLTSGWTAHFTRRLGDELQRPMRLGSTNICLQRALTWPLSAGPQRPRNPWPNRADLAPDPRPGVAAWRPLPRGGLTARRPPPCVAPTSPCRPQPSPLAPTRPCARLSAHRAAPCPSPCGDSRRSLLSPSPTPA